ncbi:MAG: DUF177 domain-containing protein [Gemmatimonadota bacterium]
MRIPVDSLRDGPWSWQGVLSADPEVWSAPGLDLTGNPRLTIRAEASADGSVHVTGELEVPFRLSCVRCLRELTVLTGLPIDAWFSPDAELASEDGVYPLDARAAEISAREPIREELVLGRPEYPLCEPECRGLCPLCGVNRNEEQCECSVAEADPRWGPLQRWLEDG